MTRAELPPYPGPHLPLIKGGAGCPKCGMDIHCYPADTPHQHAQHDDAAVRELARASLLLDLRKRKFPLARAAQDSFLRFKKSSGKLDTQAAGFGVWSDWPDLNDLCNRMAVKLEWTQHNSNTAPQASDAVVTDPSVTAEVTVHHNEAQHTLQQQGDSF